MDLRESEDSSLQQTFFAKVIEAGWIGVLVVIPLFFDKHAVQVFEPGKVTLLQVFVLILSSAWVAELTLGVARHLQGCEPGWNLFSRSIWSSWDRIVRLFPSPLITAVLLIGMTALLSQLFSVSPETSWRGSYFRAQGFLTEVSYILFFLFGISVLRSRRQWERVLYAILITSFLVAFYGILQFLGLDPIPWAGEFQTEAGPRVISTMGNPIFLGAYLLISIFITAQFTLQLVHAMLKSISPRILLSLLGIALVLMTQVTALLLTQSRGPLVGLLLGGFVFLLVLSSHERARELPEGSARRRRGSLVLIVVAGLVLTLVPAFYLLGRTGWIPESVPLVERVDAAFDLDSSTVRVRTLVWNSLMELMTLPRPLEDTLGNEDPAFFWRPFFGYGLDSLTPVLSRFYPPELGHLERPGSLPDRAHNELLDVFGMRGLAGAGALLFLWGTVFYYAICGIGLASDGVSRRQLKWSLILGTACVPTLSWMISGSKAVLGPAVMFGLAGSVCFYLILRLLRPRPQPIPGSMRTRQWLYCGILAALVAHLTESQFGITTTSTRVYFWALLSLLVVLRNGRLRLEPSRTDEGVSSRKIHSFDSLFHGLVLGLIATVLSYEFTAIGWVPGQGVTARIGDWTARVPQLVFLFAFACLVGFLLFWVLDSSRLRALGVWRIAVAFLTPGIGLGYLYLSGHGIILKRMTAWAAGGSSRALTLHFELMVLFLTLVLLIMASLLMLEPRGPSARVSSSRTARIAALIVFLLPLVMIPYILSLERTQILLKFALRSSSVGQPANASYLLGYALKIHSGSAQLRSVTGQTLLNQAMIESARENQEKLMGQAVEMQRTAQELDPFDFRHLLDLGRLYQTGAQLTEDASRRARLQRKADQAYMRTIDLVPGMTPIRIEYGEMKLLRGEPREAEQVFAAASLVDPESAELLVGLATAKRIVAALAMTGGESADAKRLYQEAEAHLKRAVSIEPQLAVARKSLGLLYLEMERLEAALEQFLQSIELGDRSYATYEETARIYKRLGRPPEALRYALQAVQLAPSDQASRLEEFVRGLEVSVDSAPLGN